MPSSPSDNTSLSPREQADLSALADGTLDPARRAEVEARIAQSPELTALYERERRVVELVHRANDRTRAPLGLRERIEAQRPSPGKRARRRFGYAGGLAAALAVAVLALVLLLPGGSPGAPSVSQAAGLATLGATQAAPMPDPSNPIKLGSDVEDVYFPNWEPRFNATATGQRNDTINGRPATTVFYEMQRQDDRVHDRRRAGAEGVAVEGELVERNRAVDVRAQRPPDRLVEARRSHLHPVEH